MVQQCCNWSYLLINCLRLWSIITQKVHWYPSVVLWADFAFHTTRQNEGWVIIYQLELGSENLRHHKFLWCVHVKSVNTACHVLFVPWDYFFLSNFDQISKYGHIFSEFRSIIFVMVNAITNFSPWIYNLPNFFDHFDKFGKCIFGCLPKKLRSVTKKSLVCTLKASRVHHRWCLQVH